MGGGAHPDRAGGGVVVAADAGLRRSSVNPDRNVLLVTIDTLRADALGSYGGRAVDAEPRSARRRAARASTFAHAHAVVTLPSHATHPDRPLPVRARHPRQHRLSARRRARPTAATLLKARGFATGAFVGGFPLDRPLRPRTPASTSTTIELDPAHVRPNRASASGAPMRSSTSALEWIGAQQGKWFAWVHVYDPHATYAAACRMGGAIPVRSVSRRSVAGPTPRSARCFDRLAAQPRPTLVDRHRGSRREPRRARRADPRRVRLRVDAARAADRRGGRSGARRNATARASSSTRRSGTSTCCRRSSTPRGAPAVPGLPGGSSLGRDRPARVTIGRRTSKR